MQWYSHANYSDDHSQIRQWQWHISRISLYLWTTDVDVRIGWQILTIVRLAGLSVPLSVWSQTLDFLTVLRRFFREIAGIKPSSAGWSESIRISRERERFRRLPDEDITTTTAVNCTRDVVSSSRIVDQSLEWTTMHVTCDEVWLAGNHRM